MGYESWDMGGCNDDDRPQTLRVTQGIVGQIPVGSDEWTQKRGDRSTLFIRLFTQPQPYIPSPSIQLSRSNTF